MLQLLQKVCNTLENENIPNMFSGSMAFDTMQDTSPEMRKKQYEIFFQLSPEERGRQGMEMVAFGLMVVENSLKAQNPTFSALELKIEKLKRLYKNDLPEEMMQQVIQHFINLENPK